MSTFLKSAALALKKHLPKVSAITRSNHVRAVIVSILCLSLACILTGITIATHIVYINDGNQTEVLYTMKSDVDEILGSLGIALSENDQIEFNGFNEKNIGTIEIKRAFQLPITADGETKTVAVAEATVAEVLELAGITLSDDDLINVGLNEQVHEDTEIVINRVTYRTVNKTTSIPFTVTKQNSLMVGKGNTKIAYAGKEGSRMTVSKEKLVDGEVVSSEVLSENVITNPIAQVLLVGLAPKTPISVLTPPNSLKLDQNGVPTNYVKKVTGKSVAYSALGRYTKLKPGNVAVDYRKFPKGTKMWITTPDNKFVYGYAVAADTGAFAQDPNCDVLVDLFFNSYYESVRWGAKQVNIYVLP